MWPTEEAPGATAGGDIGRRRATLGATAGAVGGVRLSSHCGRRWDRAAVMALGSVVAAGVGVAFWAAAVACWAAAVACWAAAGVGVGVGVGGGAGVGVSGGGRPASTWAAAVALGGEPRFARRCSGRFFLFRIVTRRCLAMTETGLVSDVF